MKRLSVQVCSRDETSPTMRQLTFFYSVAIDEQNENNFRFPESIKRIEMIRAKHHQSGKEIAALLELET